MALVLTEDEVMLIDSASTLFTREAPVTAFRALRDRGDALAYDPALLAELAANGLVAPNVAEADGGIGLGAAAAGLIAERAGHTLAAAPLVSAAMAAVLIDQTGSEPQKAQLLPALVAGKMILVPALDEAPRHNPARLATQASGDEGGWTLTGTKTAVIDGVGADRYLVSALVDGVPALFLVEKDARGLGVEKVATLDSRNHARLTLTDTPGARLGAGDADRAIAAARDLGRALLAAEMLGMADEAFDRTLGYLKERKQFDRIIGTFQALQHRAARLYARLVMARGVVLKALRAIDADEQDASHLASLSKAAMTKLSRDVMIEAMQMHGGIGVTDEFDIGLFVKRARVAGELLGDDAFHTERLAKDRWQL